MAYYLIFAAIMLLSWMVQNSLNSKFKKFSQIANDSNLTGREVAEKMLHDHGIYDVKVTSTPGMLTDHYNPVTKTVNLSEGVYSSNSIAAAAVAAHECGHAVQHATAYSWISLRSSLVPIVSFSDRVVPWVLLIGILMVETFPGLLLIGILLFAMTTLFSFVTLPVEIDASKRAIFWLDRSGIALTTKSYAVSALKSAAYTYVVAALSSLATLMYYIFVFMGRSRD